MGRPRTIPRYEFAGIYQILNLINGKIYIGQAQNIFQRINEHRRRRNGKTCYKNTYLYNAVKKYGWNNFSFSVIEKVNNISKLNEKEMFWIKLLQSSDERYGYNMREGGETARGWIHTDNSKSSMSTSKSKLYIGRGNPFYGKHHTKETKEKISIKNKGRKWTTERKLNFKKPQGAGKQPRPVLQINTINNQIIQRWDSIAMAGRTLGILQSEIVMVANQTPCKKNGKLYTKKTAGGYRWQYA